jgi:hypothetical protein
VITATKSNPSPGGFLSGDDAVYGLGLRSTRYVPCYAARNVESSDESVVAILWEQQVQPRTFNSMMATLLNPLKPLMPQSSNKQSTNIGQKGNSTSRVPTWLTLEKRARIKLEVCMMNQNR